MTAAGGASQAASTLPPTPSPQGILCQDMQNDVIPSLAVVRAQLDKLQRQSLTSCEGVFLLRSAGLGLCHVS